MTCENVCRYVNHPRNIVLESIKVLLEDPTFNSVLENQKNLTENREDDILSEVRDGSLLRSIPYYQKNPDSFVGMLYSDAVEITSPLSASKGLIAKSNS